MRVLCLPTEPQKRAERQHTKLKGSLTNIALTPPQTIERTDAPRIMYCENPV